MGSLGKKQNHPVDQDLVFSSYPFPCHIIVSQMYSAECYYIIYLFMYSF
jgi:hypothetical protein